MKTIEIDRYIERLVLEAIQLKEEWIAAHDREDWRQAIALNQKRAAIHEEIGWEITHQLNKTPF